MSAFDFLRRKPRTGPELDRLSLQHLRKAGADLNRPRHVLHFLYFEDEPAARAAAEEVSAGGYTVSVTAPAHGDTHWVVQAETTRVVDARTVPAYRRSFERIASDHGGEYDGWEAAAKP
jgi:hypothetical protein